jgi:hypothetical protein
MDKAHPDTSSLCVTKCDTNTLLRRFWKDEEIPQKLSLREEEEQCERHFVSTHSRTAEGKYTVRLSFNRSTHRYWHYRSPHSTCSNGE